MLRPSRRKSNCYDTTLVFVLISYIVVHNSASVVNNNLIVCADLLKLTSCLTFR